MELLAVLESLPGAEPQGFHCYSDKPGASGIISYEQDQLVYVLFFTFGTMRIQEDLRKDRLAPTLLVRTIHEAKFHSQTRSGKMWLSSAFGNISFMRS
jgi:hypothetical protein